MTIDEVRTKVVQVDLPAGRALRLEVELLPDGTPDTLRIREGWTGPWRPERGREVHVPATALPDLLAALRALEAA